MDRATRQSVAERAGGRCEYCRLREEDDALRFHVEHVVPRKHGGTDSRDNLALACQNCNLHKGSNLAGVDPVTGEMAPLFDPRSDRWDEHFVLRGARIEGVSNVGRTTVHVLCMNDPDRVQLRRLLGY